MNNNTYKTLEEIAEKWFDVETLETRNSDSLDFYDVAIWSIKEALHEAYLEGQKSNVQ